MTLTEFISYKPSCTRLGQWFMISYMREVENLLLFYEKDDMKSLLMILNIIQAYNWDISRMPPTNQFRGVDNDDTVL